MAEEGTVSFGPEYIRLKIESVKEVMHSGGYRREDTITLLEQRFDKDSFDFEAVVLAANNITMQHD